MATLRPHGRDVAPLRLSVERALSPSQIGLRLALLALSVSGGGDVAAKPFRMCTDTEREFYRTKVTHEFQPIVRALPRHPRGTERGYEGFVDVLIDLHVDGSVVRVCVLEARPPGIFEQVTVDAVRKWRYAPQDVAGLPKDDRRIKVHIEFRLVD
jgi:TonB family protein